MQTADIYATTPEDNIKEAYHPAENACCEHEGCAACYGLAGELKVVSEAFGGEDGAWASILLNSIEPVDLSEDFVPLTLDLYFRADIVEGYTYPVFFLQTLTRGDDHVAQEISYCPFCGASLHKVWDNVNRVAFDHKYIFYRAYATCETTEERKEIAQKQYEFNKKRGEIEEILQALKDRGSRS